MTAPILTFFNNKGGVGKTSLVYHLSWMLAEMGKSVVAIDLDPQANLTSSFLDEIQLEELWDPDKAIHKAGTIHQCVRLLSRTGDIKRPECARITERLHLVPGDLALSGFEDLLSQEWPNSLSGDADIQFRAMRVLTSLWQVAQAAALQHGADLVLADVGPNLGAINRSVLLGTDNLVIPLAADLYALQGLRNLGPSLKKWRTEWSDRLQRWRGEFQIPNGAMAPLGYVIQQHSEKLSRPVKAYDKWTKRIPTAYRDNILNDTFAVEEPDPHCLARLKHYRSLIPMAQEVRKPIFQLTAADGAIGNHAYAVQEARTHFQSLAEEILSRLPDQGNAYSLTD